MKFWVGPLKKRLKEKAWRSGRPHVPCISFLSVCLQPHVRDAAEPIRTCVDLRATPGDRASFLFLALWLQPLMSAMGFEPMRTCVQWILSSPPWPLGQTDCCRQVANAGDTGIAGDTGRSVKFWVGPLKKRLQEKAWRSGRPRVPSISFLSVCLQPKGVTLRQTTCSFRFLPFRVSSHTSGMGLSPSALAWILEPPQATEQAFFSLHCDSSHSCPLWGSNPCALACSGS